MKKKILVSYSFNKEIFKKLEADFELTYPDKDGYSNSQVLDLIQDYDVLISHGGLKVDKAIIDAGANLKLIANYGVGFNNIDVESATANNITVTNTPQSVLEPTAELCFGIMLAAARRIGFYNDKIRIPNTLSWKLYDNLGVTLYGKTLGIYGMGRIGQAVARRAIASGMKIIYNNRSRLDKQIEDKYDAKFVSLDELLKTSDFISLSAPATSETFHIIDKHNIEKMKSSAILVNASRGDLIDEKALIEALKNKRILAAALDVYENEPHPNPELFTLDNVVLTPHAGTQTLEARSDMQNEVMQNIIGFYNSTKISKVN